MNMSVPYEPAWLLKGWPGMAMTCFNSSVVSGCSTEVRGQNNATLGWVLWVMICEPERTMVFPPTSLVHAVHAKPCMPCMDGPTCALGPRQTHLPHVAAACPHLLPLRHHTPALTEWAAGVVMQRLAAGC